MRSGGWYKERRETKCSRSEATGWAQSDFEYEIKNVEYRENRRVKDEDLDFRRHF